ncbi:serine-rich adhesin for platelets [Sabethes cyaneus]|uniref:serine-rich adhesin for platelets n=1 Tax=Sabethes cyaneus TaxID=53552 RepID=UPI00237E7738|nr:serine-rich adhesin for platelets [Sabethes cyaneus]
MSAELAATIDITTIKDEDLLRKLWHDAQDFGRKREIRAHMYKLREERLKALYSQIETPPLASIMEQQNNITSKYGLSKTTVTGSHGDSLADQSFESLKSKEVRDSESPTRFGTVIPSDNSGWHVTKSEEVSADGTHTVRSSATTEGTKEVEGGRTAFTGKNEEAVSERMVGDADNFVHNKKHDQATFLAEKGVFEKEDGSKVETSHSTSVTSSSSRMVSSSKQVTGDEADFVPIKMDTSDMKISHQQTSDLKSQRTRNRVEYIPPLETSEKVEYSKYDRPNDVRLAEVMKLIEEPGEILSREETMLNSTTKEIVVKKKINDGTIVTHKTFEKIGQEAVEQPPEQTQNLSWTQYEYDEFASRSGSTSKVVRDETEYRSSKKEVADKVTNQQFIAEERTSSQQTEQMKKQQEVSAQHKITVDVDAAHDSFARSLRSCSPTGSVRSVHSTSGRSSVSPDKSTRNRRSPSRDSDTSRFSTHTTTRSSRTDVSHKDYMRPTVTSERKQSNFKETTIQESSSTEAYDTVDKTKLKERSLSPRKVPQNTPDMTPRGLSPDKLSRQSSPGKTPKESSPFCSVGNSRSASPLKRDGSPTKTTSEKLVRTDSSETFNIDTTITISTNEKLQQQVREDVEVFDTKSNITNLDDITIKVNLENVTDDIEITTTVEQVDLKEDKTTGGRKSAGTTKAAKPTKQKPPLIRSETFEERCRKILGMPDTGEPVEETAEPDAPSIFSTYDNTMTRSSEMREKRKKIEQEIKSIETETRRSSRKTDDFIAIERGVEAKNVSPVRKPSEVAKEPSPARKTSVKERSPSKAASPVRKPLQPSPERQPQQQSKEPSPVRKHSQPSPERRPKDDIAFKQPKETSPSRKPSSPERYRKEPKGISSVRTHSQQSPERHPRDFETTRSKPVQPKELSPSRKPSHASPERYRKQPKGVSPVRTNSQQSPERHPKDSETITSRPVQSKEGSPFRCSRSHERTPSPTEKKPTSPVRKASAGSPTRKSSHTTETSITKSTTSKADILVNQKKEGKNLSVTEITIQPIVDSKKSDKILTKQTSDSKFEQRRTTSSRAVTSKSSSDFDVKRKAVYDKIETTTDKSVRAANKPRTPATSPDKRRPQDSSPTKSDKPKNHITVAKIKIEPVRKPVQSKVAAEDKIGRTTTKTIKTVRKVVGDYTEAESDKDTGISDNEAENETLTTVQTTTTTFTTARKQPTSDRKDSAPVYRTTGKVEKTYPRSSSDNGLKANSSTTTTTTKKTTTTKTTTTANNTSAATKKTDRPVKCVSTKTINLSTKPAIDSGNLDNVIIDIQQAKSSREPTPNKLIPIPVSPDEDTGKPRYPDAVQEPDDEPRREPRVNNIPIFEEATNEYVGCEITEVEDHEVRAARASRITNLDRVTEDDESLLSVTQKVSKFVEEANKLKDVPTTKTPNRFVRHEYEELDEHLKSDECLLSVSDKVTKFISTAEEVKKIKTSGPFVPECKVTVDVAGSDDCLLSVNEKVSKFANVDVNKSTDWMTSSVTSTTDEMDRSTISVTDNDDSLLSVSEKKKKFISGSSAPQKSPELVKNVMKQTSRSEKKADETLNGLGGDQKTKITERYTTATLTKPKDKVPQGVGLRSTEAVKKVKEIFENGGKAAASETARQKDILSRPSVWEDRRKKEASSSMTVTTTEKTQVKTTQEKDQKDVKLTDIGVYKRTQPKTEKDVKKDEPAEVKPETPKTRRGSGSPQTPAYIRDTVSTKKDLFEKRISSSKLDTSELIKSTTSQEDAQEFPRNTAKRPSISEKYERSISRDTPTPGNKPSYMNHTVSSLEHMNSSRRESIDNSQRSIKIEEQIQQQDSTTKMTNKFGVELKRTDSGRNVLSTSPVKRKSSIDTQMIEENFDLESLEKMLENVTGYEQRRRIRAQIRLVKKMGEKPGSTVTTMTTTTTTVRTNRIRDASPKRKESSPTRAPKKDAEVRVTKTVEVEKKSEPFQRSVSPTKPTKTAMNEKSTITSSSTTTTSSTSTAKTPKLNERITQKEAKEDKPIWATSNILKKASDTTRTFRTSSTMSSAKKTTSTMREVPKETKPTDCITSSYGVGPTDENGLPLFGIRALKKKSTAPPADTETSSKITGTFVTETLYSENGSAPVGERKTTVYSSDAKDLEDLNLSSSKRSLAEVREKLLERENSRKGLISVTKTEKFSNGNSQVTTEIGTMEDFPHKEPKVLRKGSVKELTERFVHKESSSSLVSEKSYPKAGLILRSTQSHSSRSSTPCEISSVRSGSVDFDENDIELRAGGSSSIRSAMRESVMSTSATATEQDDADDGVVLRKSQSSSSTTRQTRSFLNDGSRVSGVQDVLERMRNADNVEETGDNEEDREARALLNKFLGASVLMSGMESMIASGMKEQSSTVECAPGTQKVSRVTTTRTVKSNSSSSNNASKPSIDNIEHIWDEAVLKQLLDSSTNYEERRKIRTRLRQIMAEKEACADIVASVTADLQRERQLQHQQSANDSSNSTASGLQGESLLLPLLQGILLHNKSGAGGSNGIVGTAASLAIPPVEDSGTESGEDLRLLAAGLHDNIEMYRGIGVGSAAAATACGSGISGDGSSISNGRPQEGGENILHEVTAALQRLQLSLREGKDINLEMNKRNALLTLVCRLQMGLMQPDKLPEQISPVGDLDDNGETPDYNQMRRGSGRFAKRRNRNNRHTVGVSREELADARRFIEEIGRIGDLSPHSMSATPEKSKTPEKSQLAYSLQKQQSFGTILPAQPVAPASVFAMKRPSQFVPKEMQTSNFKNHVKSNDQATPYSSRDRKAKQKLFRQSQSFEQPSVNDEEPIVIQHKPIDVKPSIAANRTDPFKKPVQTAAQRALVKKYSFNDGSTSEEDEPRKSAEQVVLQKNSNKGTTIVNTVQKIVDREVKSSQPVNQHNISKHAGSQHRSLAAHDLHGHEGTKPVNKYTSKKLRMKRANTIDIPKKLLNNEIESDEESEEDMRIMEKSREAKPKTAAELIVKPVNEVPNFKPKTENDKKFMAFLQKQNQATKQMWTNPVKEHVGANNWTNKFDHLKHNFENADKFGKVASPCKSATPKNSAMNFWKKAESASFDETLHAQHASSVKRESSKPPRSAPTVQNYAPLKAPVQPKLPPKPVFPNHLPSTSVVKSKTAPHTMSQPVTSTHNASKPPTSSSSQAASSNQFSHAPTSAFKPIAKKPAPINLDFKPIHHEPEVVKPIPSHVTSGVVKQIVASGFKETPDVKPEPLNVQIGLVKSLAAAGYHETPYVPPPKIERTPTHHVLNYQAKPERAESPTPAAPWIGKKTTENNSRVASIASTKFTANQFGLNKGALPTQTPLTYQGSLKYNEKPAVIQYSDRLQGKRPSLPDVGERKSQPKAENFTYTFTDYTLPESISTFTLNRSDSLTNPDNQPLILTSTNSIYSPCQQQINFLSVTDQHSSTSLSPNNEDGDDLDSLDSQEMRVTTKVMRAPVSQQASYTSSKTSHLGSSPDRGSLIAQNLQSSLKKIQQKSPTPPSRQMTTAIQRTQPQQYAAPKPETITQTPAVMKPQPPAPPTAFNIPPHAIFNNVHRNPLYEPPRPAPLARTDSWTHMHHHSMSNGLERAKSSHTLAVPSLLESSHRPQQNGVISDKQRTMEAYFAGQKPSLNPLTKTPSTSNFLRDKSGMSQNNVRPVSYAMGNSYNPAQYNIRQSIPNSQTQQMGGYPALTQSIYQPASQQQRTSSIVHPHHSQQQYYHQPPLGTGLVRSRTMPHIPLNNLNLLDEDNVDDAFEELMSQSFAA